MRSPHCVLTRCLTCHPGNAWWLCTTSRAGRLVLFLHALCGGPCVWEPFLAVTPSWCVYFLPPPQSPWCGLLLAVHNDVLDGGPPDLPSWTADVFARGTVYHVPAHSVTRYLPGAATVAAGALLAAAFTTCSPQEADEGVMGPQLQLPYSR